ncbi:MAG: hypothetical protein QXV60_00665 [Nitrososphaerota archaeon]
MVHTGISVGILVFILIVMIVYSILMFEFYKNHTFIFSPYKPPDPPVKFFRPLGEVIPMTQEEIETRNNIIKNSMNIR